MFTGRRVEKVRVVSRALTNANGLNLRDVNVERVTWTRVALRSFPVEHGHRPPVEKRPDHDIGISAYNEHVSDRLSDFPRIASPSFSASQPVYFISVLQESVESRHGWPVCEFVGCDKRSAGTPDQRCGVPARCLSHPTICPSSIADQPWRANTGSLEIEGSRSGTTNEHKWTRMGC